MQRLEGCLGDLPDRLRLVLQLRTGFDALRAISPAAIAKYLHIRVRQIPQLEKQALRRLRLTARAHTCGKSAQTLSGLLVSVDSGPALGGEVSAASGVEAVRYAKSPSLERSGLQVKQASPSGDTLLGIIGPPQADETWLSIIIILAGALLTGFLFADKLEVGSRYRQARSRWMRRHTR